MAFPNDRNDDIYIVVTVLKTKNKYEIRLREPQNLAPNQMAVRVSFTMDTKDWFDRIVDVAPVSLVPPEKIKIDSEELSFGKTTGEKVMDRLKG